MIDSIGAWPDPGGMWNSFIAPRLLGFLALTGFFPGLGVLSSEEPAFLPPLVEGIQPGMDIERHPGKHIWAELFTEDLEEASRFYSELFDWDPEPLQIGPHSYVLFRNQGTPVAGAVYREQVAGEDTRGIWVPYFSIDNVASTVEQVVQSGGRVLASPQRILNRGTHAILAGPQGGIFGVLRSSSGDPPDYLVNYHAWIWVQLFALNPEQSKAFLEAMSLEVVEDENTESEQDYIFMSDGFARGGIMYNEQEENGRSDWLNYIRVEDVKAMTKKAERLGATILVYPNDDFFDGKVAIFIGPAGGGIGLLEWNMEAMDEPMEDVR